MEHPSIEDPINHLDIGYKESIIALLFRVQTGQCSCRKAASLLMEEHNKAMIQCSTPTSNYQQRRMTP